MITSGEIQRIARGEISDKTVEKDYIQSWVLISLSNTELREKLIFKGGTALRKFYFENYRYSEDLDFTLSRESQKDMILDGFKEIIPVLRELANIQMQVNPEYEEHENTITCYINYIGPFGGMIERNQMKTNITVKELLLYPINDGKLLLLYSDQPKNITYPVYSLEEIVIEKLCCILDSARHEPRDIYDFWCLMEDKEVTLEALVNAFSQKCEFKQLEVNRLKEQVEKKEAVYKNLWETRLKKQMVRLPPFENVYRTVKRHLRKTKLV